jgi:hypothetical protein
MSLLSSLTSILELIKIPGIGVSREEYKATKLDDCSDGKLFKWNEDHNGRDDYSKNDGDKDDYSKLIGKDDYSKDDYSKHDGGWSDAMNDNYQPQQHYGEPSDDSAKGNTYLNPGEALAKCDLAHGDFSHGDFGSHGPDHSGDMLGALASMLGMST